MVKTIQQMKRVSLGYPEKLMKTDKVAATATEIQIQMCLTRTSLHGMKTRS
jgi:hypothetical protein